MSAKASYLIITFCYAYIAGIVLDMLFPAGTAIVGVLWICSAILLAATGVYTLIAAFGSARIHWWFVVCALSSACIFGYTRHMSVNTIPDQRIATLRVAENGSISPSTAFSLPDTSRIRLVKTTESSSDITVSVSGELQARQLADTAHPLNQDDRWKFTIVRSPVSETITIRAEEPVGTMHTLTTPFTSIKSVKCLSGTGPAAFELWRVSNHARSFARAGRFRPSVTVLGKITQDPQVRPSRTVLSVTPDFIQYEGGGPYYKITGGDIQIMLYPDTTGYDTFAHTAAYGYHCIARGELRAPMSASNPGGFDQKRYMYNHNFYGTLFPQNDSAASPAIVAVAPDNGTYAQGNWLVEFSLDLRDRMLAVIKQTLPMPHSAFVGAVTLGMRYGLAEAQTLFSDYYRLQAKGISRAEYENMNTTHTGYEDTIADEFKRAGVNHVLAVSGLHVTIITAMFVGIFSLLRIPRRMFVPITIFALIIFAIITGARPSTLRAVIMNSLFLLTWAYLERGLRSAALFGVAVAGFLILIHNPLMIVDPSFTLSFGAILSLVLLTGPIYERLAKLHGNLFLVFLLCIGITTILAIRNYDLLRQPIFLLLYGAGWLLIGLGAAKVQKRFSPIGDIGYQDLPTPFSAFFAAQFAIQIGMMIPLSALYFARWPMGGAFANLIAIPLIGVIVQLGVIAGLLGLIPGVGIYLALVLSAANWVCSYIFLFVSHVVAQAFPYPFVNKPSLWFLVVYYAACFIFVYHASFRAGIRKILSPLRATKAWHEWVAIGLLLALLASPLVFSRDTRRDTLRISILSVRYGSSILVQTPRGANLLFDAASVSRTGRPFNNALMTVIPYLSQQKALHLDAAVLLSPNIQRSAGMADILNELHPARLFVPDSLHGVSSVMEEDDFSSFIQGARLDSGPDNEKFTSMYREIVEDNRWPNRLSLLKVLRQNRVCPVTRFTRAEIKVLPLRAGQVIWREPGPDGHELLIDVIHPDRHLFESKNMDNRSPVVRVTYGDFRMLMPGDLHYQGQQYLAGTLPAQDLRSSVVIIPGHGTHLPEGAYERFDSAMRSSLQSGLLPLLKKAQPDTVIFEYGDPHYVVPWTYRDMRNAYDFTFKYLKENLPDVRVLSTDRDQAILISSDGSTSRVTTQAELTADSGETVGEGASDIGYAF